MHTGLLLAGLLLTRELFAGLVLKFHALSQLASCYLLFYLGFCVFPSRATSHTMILLVMGNKNRIHMRTKCSNGIPVFIADPLLSSWSFKLMGRPG